MRKFFSILAMCLVLSFTVSAQKQLVADETTIDYLTKQIKVETSNELIKDRLDKSEFQNDCQRVSIRYKMDRQGRYKVYTFYYPKDKDKEIIKFIRGIKR